MKIAVIDIGSNSVRLMIRADGVTLYKRVCTTRLGERLSLTGRLSPEAIERTAQALASFVKEAMEEGVRSVSAFATAAVRSAENGAAFVRRVRELTGIDVDVISGETEAIVGILGALGNGEGTVIDIGGASTEISVQKEGKLIYSRSVDIGTVRLFDLCGSDENKLTALIEEKLQAYGNIPRSGELYGIGGTATTVGAVFVGEERFQSEKVHGVRLSIQYVHDLAKRVLPLSVDERAKIKGMDRRKLDVIGGGMLLMSKLMELLGRELTVSCADNLEGYAAWKRLDQ